MQIKMEAALPVALVITLAATLADGTRVAHRFPPDPTAPARLLEHLDKQPGLWAGFIDPTQPPYSAKGDGVSDDGPSLQSAVDDAYTARMSVVLPAGKTFLMAQQLGFLQRNRSRAFGFQIFGGDGPQRPVLKLKVRRRLVLSLSLSLSLFAVILSHCCTIEHHGEDILAEILCVPQSSVSCISLSLF